MRFLVDECVGTTVSEFLKSNNHLVISVFDELRGASDDELLSKSNSENYILITSDKDFAKWFLKIKNGTKA